MTEIQTSAQAAEALRAVTGPLTFAVFAAGIVGTGMPALAGSAAYALGETLSWRVGLARAPPRAKEFYATIAVGMFLGVELNFSPIDAIKALYWSAVLNGVVAVPLMVTMMFYDHAAHGHGEVYPAADAADHGLARHRDYGNHGRGADLVMAEIVKTP